MKTGELAAAALIAVYLSSMAHAATNEAAEAETARKKPLQRCDQLKDKAELECLQKARERIVEARKKRESSGKADESKLARKDDPKKDDTKEAAKKK
jgi:hypothetical protein